MKYFIVDAFTREAFGGNPAGVVLLDQDFPDERLMTQVAAELRYSETAFVQHNGPKEYTVRYFTPTGEVDLCGHATISTFGVLRQQGLLADGDVCLNHTLAGDLEVAIGEQVMMQMATPTVVDRQVDADRLHRIMDPTAAIRWPDSPIEIVSTGLPDIILPMASVEDLNDMRPDMEALSAISQELKVVGAHAFALTDDGYTAHVRNFGPLYGIPEESATGTANAALTHYLHRRGLIAAMTVLKPDGSIWVGGESRIIAIGEFLV